MNRASRYIRRSSINVPVSPEERSTCYAVRVKISGSLWERVTLISQSANQAIVLRFTPHIVTVTRHSYAIRLERSLSE